MGTTFSSSGFVLNGGREEFILVDMFEQIDQAEAQLRCVDDLNATLGKVISKF